MHSMVLRKLLITIVGFFYTNDNKDFFLPFCLFMVGLILQDETMMSAKTRHQRKLYEEVSLNESFNRSTLLIV